MTKIEELLDILDKYRNLSPVGEPFPKEVVVRYALAAIPELRALREWYLSEIAAGRDPLARRRDLEVRSEED